MQADLRFSWLHIPHYWKCHVMAHIKSCFRWLQPDSYIEPKQCEILYSKEDLKCSWPNIITVLTKDQYGHLAHTPNLKVGFIMLFTLQFLVLQIHFLHHKAKTLVNSA